MALSEREQKLLQQMEQALYAEDPRFATKLRSAGGASSRRRLLVGLLGVLVGMALVIFGVLGQAIWLGAIGFVVMVAAAAFAFAPARKGGPSGTVTADGGVAPVRAKTTGGFMRRLEQRWERRSRDEW